MSRSFTWIDDARRDVWHSARLLRRNPVFGVTAALSLAIGIAANTTIFTVANRLLLRHPTGVAQPDRVVDISPVAASGWVSDPLIPAPMYEEIRARTTTLTQVFGYQIEPQALSLASEGGAERIFGTIVTPNYFAGLGVRAAAGRLFGDGDDATAVVLSHAFWSRRFQRDPAIVGRAVRLSGRSYTVVGVADEAFRGTSVVIADAWLPWLASQQGLRAEFVRFVVSGRLADGVSPSQAGAEIDAIGRALRRSGSAGPDVPGAREVAFAGLRAAPASAIPPAIRVQIAAFLAFLMGIVSIVLVIACANVAGVLLARATARRREIAVRLAIGASRWRLVRQLFAETLLLVACGGAAGLLLARFGTSILVRALPALPVPFDLALPLDIRVLLFTAGVSLASALVCGLVPAWQATKADVVAALKNDEQGPSDRLRLRRAFVVAQIAFSMLLVIVAGLFARAMARSTSVDLGFDPRGVEVAAIDLSLAGADDAHGMAFVERLRDALRRVPEIESSSIALHLPVESAQRTVGVLRRPGQANRPIDPAVLRELPSTNVVSPGYFATVKTPIVAGRDFTDADRSGSQPVVIVNQAAARKYWPGQDAVGQYLPARTLALDPLDVAADPPLLVVGVARDITNGQDAAPPLVHLPFAQAFRPTFSILARTTRGQRAAGRIRALVAALDPNLPIVSLRTLEDQTSPAVVQLRVSAAVAGPVGIVGLLLAAVGVYGLTAYSVARRTREIGIRMALGAERADVVSLVLRQGLGLVAIGSTIGLLLGAAVSRMVVRLLFGVPPLDPVTFAGAAALFAVVGAVACAVPVHRATRIQPLDALRHD